jgi:hypothetical protein
MIERIVTVKSATFTETPDKKKQWLMAVLVEDDGTERKQAVFEPELQKIVQEAYKDKGKLSIKIEKEGNFWNLKEATLLPSTIPTSQNKPTPVDREDNILLSVAFKGATECEGYWFVPDGKPHHGRVIEYALYFFNALKEIRDKGRFNPVVQEVKNLGGTEK